METVTFYLKKKRKKFFNTSNLTAWCENEASDIWGILKAELQPQSTETQFAAHVGRKMSANREGVTAGGRQTGFNVRNVWCFARHTLCRFKIRKRDHDDRVASSAFNQSGVGRIDVDVWAKESAVNHWTSSWLKKNTPLPRKKNLSLSCSQQTLADILNSQT